MGTFLLALVMLRIAYLRGLREISKQRKKAKEKTEKVKEKEKKEKKEKKVVNQDIVTALQGLGFKRQESIDAAQKAVEKLGEAEIEKLIKEALKQI